MPSRVDDLSPVPSASVCPMRFRYTVAGHRFKRDADPADHSARRAGGAGPPVRVCASCMGGLVVASCWCGVGCFRGHLSAPPSPLLRGVRVMIAATDRPTPAPLLHPLVGTKNPRCRRKRHQRQRSRRHHHHPCSRLLIRQATTPSSNTLSNRQRSRTLPCWQHLVLLGAELLLALVLVLQVLVRRSSTASPRALSRRSLCSKPGSSWLTRAIMYVV